MKGHISFLLLLLILTSNAQVPTWEWKKTQTSFGKSSDIIYGMKTDAAGNSYVVGKFYSDTINFGSFQLLNSDTTETTSDFFIIKYDTNGDVVWAKKQLAGGYGNEELQCVTIDNLGYIYVSGNFLNSSITVGSTTLVNSSPAYYDVFCIKYDSFGNVIWAKKASGNKQDRVLSISIDVDRNIYLAGKFSSDIITFDGLTLSNPTSGHSIFLVKYDDSGNVLWVKRHGFVGLGGYVSDIATDESNNIYMAGAFSTSSITFQGGATINNFGSTSNQTNSFLVKFDTYGNYIWSRTPHSVSSTGGITVDSKNNITYIGTFNNSIFFPPTTLSGSGLSNLYAVKYDSTGNVIWAKGFEGTARVYPFNIIADQQDCFYLSCGLSEGFIKVGADSLHNSDSVSTTRDSFLAKLDSNGTAIFTKSIYGNSSQSIYGNSSEYAYGLSSDGQNNIYISGCFDGTKIYFDSTEVLNADTAMNFNNDIFIAKLGSGITNIDSNIKIFSNNVAVYPNPFNSEVELSFDEVQNNCTIKVLNIMGAEVQKFVFSGKNVKINRGTLNNGIYFIQIIDSNFRVINKKVIIQ